MIVVGGGGSSDGAHTLYMRSASQKHAFYAFFHAFNSMESIDIGSRTCSFQMHVFVYCTQNRHKTVISLLIHGHFFSFSSLSLRIRRLGARLEQMGKFCTIKVCTQSVEKCYSVR